MQKVKITRLKTAEQSTQCKRLSKLPGPHVVKLSPEEFDKKFEKHHHKRLWFKRRDEDEETSD